MIVIGGRAYELVHEHKDGWKPDVFRERYSEVLDRYDYIVGDWGYNQLRLKGFFSDDNTKAAKDTLISSVQDYLQEYCNFGCAYFILKRLPDPVPGGNGPNFPAEGGFEDAAAEGNESAPDSMAWSDRKPYSWREHQSPLRGQRHAERADAAGNGKAAEHGGGLRRDARVSGSVSAGAAGSAAGAAAPRRESGFAAPGAAHAPDGNLRPPRYERSGGSPHRGGRKAGKGNRRGHHKPRPPRAPHS